jgi:NADPH-dependent 2,4-dienoyl-CoA reductase/sulfur reductase-like enzyme
MIETISYFFSSTVPLSISHFIIIGGALATLVGAHLALNDIANIKHFSFGSPRVANAAAASFISSVLPIVRTTHYRDIVVHNPFESFGYTHVTTEWYENNHGKFISQINLIPLLLMLSLTA